MRNLQKFLRPHAMSPDNRSWLTVSPEKPLNHAEIKPWQVTAFSPDSGSGLRPHSKTEDSMSHEIAPKRHMRHDATHRAEIRMTDTMTHDGSMRHASYLPSYQKPLDQADRDASDALAHKPGPKRKETTEMTREFTALKAGNYEFRDGENTRDLIAIYSGGKRVCFIEYSAARQFVDKMHDLCDQHEIKESGELNGR